MIYPKKQPKILIIDEFNSLNLGEMARVISIADSLRSLSPNVVIEMLSSSPQIDLTRYGKNRRKVIKRPWYKESRFKLLTFLYFLIVSTFTLISYIILQIFGKKGRLHRYDLFLHVTGDVINDRGLVVLFYHLYHIVFALVARKKTAICAESTGPFKSRVTAGITRIILSRVNLITLRDSISKNYLMSIGVKNPNLFLTADPAFLLKPVIPETHATMKANAKPILGVSVNPDMIPYFSNSFHKEMKAKRKKYAELLARVIDWFIENYNATVFLFAHVIRPDSDDIKMSEEIYGQLQNKSKVQFFRHYFTAEEIKGLISLCDVFLGSRMHATIAAISSGVPTVILGHTHKFLGVLGDLVDQKTIIDIRGKSLDIIQLKLKAALDYVWQNRLEIKKRYHQKLPHLKELALTNAKLLVNLLRV